MAQGEQPPGKFNIKFGNVTQSQIVMGDYNTVAQKVGLTPQETAELRSVFGDLRTTVAEQAQQAQRDEALEQAEAHERAVDVEPPDPGRCGKVLGWFSA